MVAKAKGEADAESSKRIAAAKAKLDAELKAATKALNAVKESSMAGVEAEVSKLSDFMVKKVTAGI